ncbi:MAG: M3 family metallopeptidase [Trueperaceae bacterium]|nr:M3 family metallopeptidase [Trueperaceae bacterium]
MPSVSSPANDNPLLRDDVRVPFDEIRAAHVGPGLRAALEDAEATFARVGSASPPYRWDELLGAIDRAEARMGRAVAIVSHLNSVRQDPDVREAWSAILPELAAFEARQRSDPAVYRVLTAYAETDEATSLPPERARFLELTLDAMRRSGAGLDRASRERAEAIQSELAALANTFQNNVLDGTNAFALDVEDEGRLDGVPASALRRARAAAEAAGVDGWRFTLHQPSYLAIADHAADRDVRKAMYDAFQARGMGEGRDNREVIPRILELRRELARLLGYADWADLQIEPRMARRGATAQAFEHDLWGRVRPHFRHEIEELATFARDELGLDRLEPWDVRFAFERLRVARFDLNDEELRPWFPMDRVQAGLFEMAQRLFGVEIRRTGAEGAWHPDVEVYDVVDADGRHIGTFYTDWYPREDKRGGAWMMPLASGGPTASGFEPHLGAISGNLTPPDGDRPALLTHDEASTVFHEFGHLLHHLLSTVEIRSLGGTNVPWDFVELPSQILENWLWEDEALVRIARHVDDGTPLPEEVRTRMRAARTFGAAHHMARQLSFGTVDLALHVDYDPASDGDPVRFGREVLAPFQMRPDVVADGFLPAFAHIFAGGYAAGYYSYLWSEMLDADAFSRFRDEGLYDRDVGEAFRRTILARGNAAPPETMIREFLGRDPDPGALLARNLGLPAR